MRTSKYSHKKTKENLQIVSIIISKDKMLHRKKQ